MPNGLTSMQEIVEVQLDNGLSKPLQEQIMRVLADKPEHRIISLAVTSMDQFNMTLRALVVIEHIRP